MASRSLFHLRKRYIVFNILDTSLRSSFCYSCLPPKTTVINGQASKEKTVPWRPLARFLHYYLVNFCHCTVRISVGFLFTVKVQLQTEEILCKKLQLVCIKIFYFDLSQEKLRYHHQNVKIRHTSASTDFPKRFWVIQHLQGLVFMYFENILCDYFFLQ